MKRWEYRIEERPSIEDVQQVCDVLGRDGWELVGLVLIPQIPPEEGEREFLMAFKRKVED